MTNGKMTITLKSDLCTGSGFSYAGTVDTDVVYNKKFGFPYIPGKRIKGCMRDAAVMMGWDNKKILQVFGERGAEANSGIRIGNATLPDAEEMSEEIETLSKECKKYLSPRNILSWYTSIRSQTSVDGETGIAVENTLRFTRVVNHYQPDNENETVFQADISFDDNVTSEEIEKLANATRNIGLNRTRGLGAVSIEIDFPNEDSQQKDYLEISEDGKKIKYCVTNIEPLIMSAETDDESVGYISGTAVLGALASEYLKKGKASDVFFKRIFLQGKAEFSNLTPAIKKGENYFVTYPAPFYMQKMKKSKEIVNLFKKPEDAAEFEEIMRCNKIEDADEWRYSPQNGNQPKKLKTEFVAEGSQGVMIYEPEYEIEYHHRKKSKDMDEQLFFFSAMEPGQLFAGEITVKDAKDAEEVKELLVNANLRFGKSRGAQYGTCRLISLKKCDEKCTENPDVKGRVAVRFLSDGIFVDENGNYTVNRNEIIKKVAKHIGFKDAGVGKVYLQTKVLTGYMSVWNLQKEQIPAIAAGSVIEYDVPETYKVKGLSIGEKTNEGFGRIAVEDIGNMNYILTKYEDTASAVNEIKSEVLKSIYIKGRTQEKFDETLNDFKIDKSLSSSAIGRLTLMLDEAVNSDTDVNEQLQDLKRRIKSIKSENNQAKANVFYENILKVFDNEADEELKKSLEDMRMEMAKAVLVRMKYAKKD